MYILAVAGHCVLSARHFGMRPVRVRSCRAKHLDLCAACWTAGRSETCSKCSQMPRLIIARESGEQINVIKVAVGSHTSGKWSRLAFSPLKPLFFFPFMVLPTKFLAQVKENPSQRILRHGWSPTKAATTGVHTYMHTFTHFRCINAHLNHNKGANSVHRLVCTVHTHKIHTHTKA